jgi:hypothetical protein
MAHFQFEKGVANLKPLTPRCKRGAGELKKEWYSRQKIIYTVAHQIIDDE